MRYAAELCAMCRGTTKVFNTTCPTCHGTGRTVKVRWHVCIPCRAIFETSECRTEREGQGTGYAETNRYCPAGHYLTHQLVTVQASDFPEPVPRPG